MEELTGTAVQFLNLIDNYSCLGSHLRNIMYQAQSGLRGFNQSWASGQ